MKKWMKIWFSFVIINIPIMGIWDYLGDFEVGMAKIGAVMPVAITLVGMVLYFIWTSE